MKRRICGILALTALVALMATMFGGYVSAAESPTMLHFGEPYFVIGLYEHPHCYDPVHWTPHLQELGAAGFNSWRIWFDAVTTTHLDSADFYGVRAMGCAYANVTTGVWNHWIDNTAYHVSGSDFDDQIQLVNDHTGFLMYETVDEAMWNWLGWSQWYPQSGDNSGLAFIKARDTNHPVFYNEVAYVNANGQFGINESTFRSWMSIGDTCAQDYYPVSSSTSDLINVTVNMDAQIRIADPDGSAPWNPTKPCMAVLQGYGFSDGGGSGSRPTLAQTRYMAYASIIHGAKGILWWGCHLIETNSQLWYEIKRTAGELRDLQYVFGSGTTTGSKINGTTSGSISVNNANCEALRKSYGGINYLVVTNKSGNTLSNVQITASGWNYGRNGNKVIVMAENRKINTASTTWYDNFGPWDVHVYTDQLCTYRKNDYDGDGLADPAVATSNMYTWKNLRTTSGCTVPNMYDILAGANHISVPADYDGDGRTDVATYVAGSNSYWNILQSSCNSDLVYGWQWVQWGHSADNPITGDWDGDGKCDLGLWTPTANEILWQIKLSSGGYITLSWGNANSPWNDKPISGDYDGDGKTDITVYRPGADSYWYVLKSSTNFSTYAVYQWGHSADLPISGDYDGDGTSDLALYTPGNPILWQVSLSGGGYLTRYYGYSQYSDIPVSGDYDGDGKTDIVIYRPGSSGVWCIYTSGSNFVYDFNYWWGTTGDVPVGQPTMK